MIHTMDDLIRLSREEPGLHQFLTLYEMGELSRVAMLTEALYWYVQALRSARAQLVEAENIRPRVYYLGPGELADVCAPPRLATAPVAPRV